MGDTDKERPSTAPPSRASSSQSSGLGPPPQANPPAHTVSAAFQGGAAQLHPQQAFLGGLGSNGFPGGGQAALPRVSAAEALSPFPGMSLHRKIAPSFLGMPFAQVCLTLFKVIESILVLSGVAAVCSCIFHLNSLIWAGDVL
jgi:hypothetical protein